MLDSFEAAVPIVAESLVLIPNSPIFEENPKVSLELSSQASQGACPSFLIGFKGYMMDLKFLSNLCACSFKACFPTVSRKIYT